MARFNKARVGLKHSGIRPSKEDIVGYRVSVANFFLENTPTVFGMEFADATLINFVKPDSARQRLMQARTSREEGNLVDAIVQATIAFYEVVEGPLEQIGPVRLGRASRSRLKMHRVRGRSTVSTTRLRDRWKPRQTWLRSCGTKSKV
jgi:hypothetical protein